MSGIVDIESGKTDDYACAPMRTKMSGRVFTHPDVNHGCPLGHGVTGRFSCLHLRSGHLKWRRSALFVPVFPLASLLGHCLLCAYRQCIHRSSLVLVGGGLEERGRGRWACKNQRWAGGLLSLAEYFTLDSGFLHLMTFLIMLFNIFYGKF